MTKRTASIMIGIILSIGAIAALARIYPPILIWTAIGFAVVSGVILVLLALFGILRAIAINIETFIWGDDKVD